MSGWEDWQKRTFPLERPSAPVEVAEPARASGQWPDHYLPGELGWALQTFIDSSGPCPECQERMTPFIEGWVGCQGCGLLKRVKDVGPARPLSARALAAQARGVHQADKRRGARTGGGGSKGKRPEKPGDRLLRGRHGASQEAFIGFPDAETCSRPQVVEPKDKLAQLRCTQSELQWLKDRAKAEGVTVADILRDALEQQVKLDSYGATPNEGIAQP